MSQFKIRKPLKDKWKITVKHNQFAWWYIKGRHQGIDLSGKTKEYPTGVGMPVYAVADGIWERATYNSKMGNTVILRHGKYQSVYGHLSRTNYIEGYTTVKAGDCIGYMGNTGKICFGAHLHFEIRKNGKSLDPMIFIEAGERIVKWVKQNPVLLRTEKNGEVWYFVKGGFVKLDKNNCWDVISKNAKGISENNYKDILMLL